jgi:hypothetical protein
MTPRAGARPMVSREAPAPVGRDGDGARKPGWCRRVWQWLMPGPDADAVLVLDRLNRQLAVLEGARAELEAGWVQGGWWTVGLSDGTPRLVTGYAAAGGHPDRVDGVCLVGALVRAGSQLPDAASHVGRAVDAVHEALWVSWGHPGAPRPCGLSAPEVRRARVRTLTQWNDQPERTAAEVLAVVDRAISATIMDLMSVPRPARAEPAGAALTSRTG